MIVLAAAAKGDDGPSWIELATLLVAASAVLGPIAVAWFQTGGPRRWTRSEVKADLEIAALLPEGSESRSHLIASAENRLKHILAQERDEALAKRGSRRPTANGFGRPDSVYWVLLHLLIVAYALGFVFFAGGFVLGEFTKISDLIIGALCGFAAIGYFLLLVRVNRRS